VEGKGTKTTEFEGILRFKLLFSQQVTPKLAKKVNFSVFEICMQIDMFLKFACKFACKLFLEICMQIDSAYLH